MGLVHVLFHAVLLFGEGSEVLEIVLFLFVECIDVELFFICAEVAETVLFIVFNCIRPEILLNIKFLDEEKWVGHYSFISENYIQELSNG